MNSLNVDSLLRDTFPLWWLGAIVLVLVLAFGLVYRKAWWPQVVVGGVGYSVLCFALTLHTRHFFGQTNLLPYALAMIAAVAFLLASYWKQPKILLQLSGFIVIFAALTSGYGQLVPQGGAQREISSDPTQQPNCWNVSPDSPLAPADEGETLLFGGVGKSKEVGVIGKAQCAACHTFHQGQSNKQAPTLHHLPKRISEGFQAKYRQIEPSLASDKQAYTIRLAKDTLEYIALSTVCHECFVLPEWERELRSARSGKDHAKLNAVFGLSSDELTAITAWLYFRDGETLPCPDEVSHTFRKALEINRYGVRNKLHQLAAPIPYQQ